AARLTCDVELAGRCGSWLPCTCPQRPNRCAGAQFDGGSALPVAGEAAVSPRALDRYAAKRTFTRTPEPPAKAAGERHGPLLFVVQKHAARRLHYDFRL